MYVDRRLFIGELIFIEFPLHPQKAKGYVWNCDMVMATMPSVNIEY
jgi:hypothetical protein